MESIARFLREDLVMLDTPVTDARGLFAQASRHLLTTLKSDAALSASLEKAFQEREQLGSTGIGHGVAIPHAYIAGIPNETLLFCRTAKPIDFQALDKQPVQLFFLLTGADRNMGLHLKMLAKLARLFHDGMILDELRKLKAPEDFLRAMKACEQRHGG